MNVITKTTLRGAAITGQWFAPVIVAFAIGCNSQSRDATTPSKTTTIPLKSSANPAQLRDPPRLAIESPPSLESRKLACVLERDLQRATVSYYRTLLAVVDRYLERCTTRLSAAGDTDHADGLAELDVVQRVKDRYRRNLEREEKRLRELDDQLAEINRTQSAIAEPLVPASSAGTTKQPFRKGVNLMPDHSLEALGLTNDQRAKLAPLSLKTVREFALFFYLPEQHALLADILEISPEEARSLVVRASACIAQTELDKLIARRERLRQTPPGTLPPHKESP